MKIPIRPDLSTEGPSTEGPTLADRGLYFAHVAENAERFKTILSNLYHPDTNPDGFINMGTSENYNMLPEVAEFVNQHFKLDPNQLSYNEGPLGTPRLRKAMASHMNRYFHPKVSIDPDHLLFGNGVTAICEMLAFSICNADDGILFSRPIYQAFKNDFGTRAKVKCVYVDSVGVDLFSASGVHKYEQALIAAEREGIRIRAILLCHPHNPLGRCYTPQTLIDFLKLCNKYEIHLICDEIYALSVYDVPDAKAVRFESILSLETQKYLHHNSLHVLYGMSKDYAASGTRLGCVYTRNSTLLRALSAMGVFQWSGGISETAAILMLENEQWLGKFLQLSRERLAAGNKLVRKVLDDEGVAYYKGANAGFFMWIDLRSYLSSSSNSSLKARWAAEEDLLKRLIENKVYITSGQDMSAEEPGWFRVIFAQDERVIKEGLRRIMEVARR
ncbi:hypothetical protein MMC07_004984 [Pseudocyphellaria aurata]|nr:hypothetical protein [Pseudocyphellaria aurata]